MKNNHAKFEAIILDMDGTLTEEPSSWVYLHGHFGTVTEARENLDAYRTGKISYAEFMRRDIALWPHPLLSSEIERLLQQIKVSKGAKELVEFLIPRVKCLVISAGIDLLTANVAKALGIKHWLANGLEVDSSGYLTGKGIERVPLNGKVAVANSLLQKESLDWSRCISVGDSKFDCDLLQNAGLSISVGNDAELFFIVDHGNRESDRVRDRAACSSHGECVDTGWSIIVSQYPQQRAVHTVQLQQETRHDELRLYPILNSRRHTSFQSYSSRKIVACQLDVERTPSILYDSYTGRR